MASDKKRPSKLYRLFDSENGFFRIMAVVFDLIELNVLTLLCCVPVVTAGASFKENFKQATVVWLVCLAIIIVMLGDIAIMGQLDPVFRGVLLVVLVIVGLAAVTIAQYYFVFLSRYDNPVKVQLRNAAMAAIGFFPRTAGMLVILGAFGFAYAAVLVYVVPLILLLGIALPQYCCALLYCPIFERLEGAPAES